MSDPLAPLNLSLVVITRDAGTELAECLDSAGFAAETIVVDSGSVDNTVEIARDRGARVVEQAWLGFGPQKNFGVAQATYDWVLSLDADERVTPALAAEIRAVLAAPRFNAYMMPRRNRFLGRWLRHGEGYPDWNLRLFHRGHARWSGDAVHEHVLADGPVGRLGGDLLHASAESLDVYLAKQNRYTTLQAEALYARGARASTLRLIGSPLVRFIRFYVLRAGFLDGVAGFAHIAIGCFNSFCKYAKLRALEQAGASAMKVLVTGAAGFIGMHLALRLRADGADVTGVDIFDAYYDVALKRDRAVQLEAAGITCRVLDLADETSTAALFRDGRFSHVAHLAAQPGVRYSLINPAAYLRNNVDAFGHVLEGCRHCGVGHLVYASSSSVYGASHTLPFSEDQNVDHPVSVYAATKRADELLAHCYSHLYRLPATGLRFFTVYGPWGRPDMAPMIFTRSILDGQPIKVFNFGKMKRDFTYVDDIVEGIVRVLTLPPAATPAAAPHAIYNIGNHAAVELESFIGELERLLGRTAVKEYLPLQAGDVPATFASVDRLAAATGFAPRTPIAEGLARFVAWYRDYYRVQ